MWVKVDDIFLNKCIHSTIIWRHTQQILAIKKHPANGTCVDKNYQTISLYNFSTSFAVKELIHWAIFCMAKMSSKGANLEYWILNNEVQYRPPCPDEIPSWRSPPPAAPFTCSGELTNLMLQLFGGRPAGVCGQGGLQEAQHWPQQGASRGKAVK